MEARQNEIQTLEADITTNVHSTHKNFPTVRQQGKIYVKSPNRSRVEITTPYKQTTITNGNQIKVIDEESGQYQISDISEKEGAAPLLPHGGGAIDPVKALEYFDLRITKNTNKEIVLEGIPKKQTPSLTKLVLTLSAEHFLPVHIALWGEEGQRISDTTITYRIISGIYVPFRNDATVLLPDANKMNVEIEFKNVAVNAPIPDEQFQIEE